MSKLQRLVAISGKGPSYNLHDFPPGAEIIFNDECPLELRVDGYDGAEESRAVIVELRRGVPITRALPARRMGGIGSRILWYQIVNRLELFSKPELVVRDE